MINWGRVAELRSEIGQEDFVEVAEIFLEEADEVIARLSDCATLPALLSDLHFLKGAALNLGLDAFAAQCQQGEQRCAAGPQDIDLSAIKLSYAQSKHLFVQKVQCNDAA